MLGVYYWKSELGKFRFFYNNQPREDTVEKAILLVDDDEDAIRILGTMLHAANRRISVMLAFDGLAALKLIREHEFDLVVSDLKMPGMNGAKLKLTVENEGINTPFVFISGWAEGEIREAILGKGILFDKPLDSNIFISTVFTLLKLSPPLPP